MEGTPPAVIAVVAVAFLVASALATLVTSNPQVIVAVASFMAGFATGAYYRNLAHRSGGTRE